MQSTGGIPEAVTKQLAGINTVTSQIDYLKKELDDISTKYADFLRGKPEGKIIVVDNTRICEELPYPNVYSSVGLYSGFKGVSAVLGRFPTTLRHYAKVGFSDEYGGRVCAFAGQEELKFLEVRHDKSFLRGVSDGGIMDVLNIYGDEGQMFTDSRVLVGNEADAELKKYGLSTEKVLQFMKNSR